MKRFQIHITKQFSAEVTIEAESEQIARSYVLSRPDSHFHWHGDLPITIELVEPIHTDDPEG